VIGTGTGAAEEAAWLGAACAVAGRTASRPPINPVSARRLIERVRADVIEELLEPREAVGLRAVLWTYLGRRAPWLKA
jgi:hypothetical protein